MQGSSLQNFQSIELKPQIWERSFRENAKSFKNRKIDYFEGHILLCKIFFCGAADAEELNTTCSIHQSQNLPRFGKVVFEKTYKIEKLGSKIPHTNFFEAFRNWDKVKRDEGSMQAHRRGSLISIGTTLFKIGRVLLRKTKIFQSV